MPASLVRHSREWLIAIFVGVFAEISILIATFLPIKTILILATNDIPGFFPKFLAEGGVIFTSGILLLVAAFFGLVGRGCATLVTKLDSGPAQQRDSDPGHFRPMQTRLLVMTEHRSVEQSIWLTLPLSAGIFLVSPVFLVLILGWYVASWLTARALLHIAPGPQGRLVVWDRVVLKWATWMKASALWSTVGVAVFTLLFFPPTLGSSAILIAALFGRRLSVAIATGLPAVPEVFGRARSGDEGSRTFLIGSSAIRTEKIRYPLEYFSTEAGVKLLGEYLLGSGYQPDSFRIIGDPTARVLSMVAVSDGSQEILLRVFGLGRDGDRDSEAANRSRGSTLRPFLPSNVNSTFVGAFPALEIPLREDFELSRPDTPVTFGQVARFQLSQELAPLGEVEKDKARTTYDSHSDCDVDVLLGLLRRASRIPGSHQQACVRVADKVPSIFEATKILPPAWVPNIPLNPNMFYVGRDESLRYLGGTAWRVGRLGDSWPKVDFYTRLLRELLAADSENLIPIELAVLNARVNELCRQLNRFQLSSLDATISALETNLFALD